MLRIALVGPFPPPYGGMATYCSRLKVGIMSQGHQCQSIKLTSTHYGFCFGVERLVSFLLASVRVSKANVDIVHCITGSQSNLMANTLPLVAAFLSRKASVLSIVGGELPQVVRSSTWLRRVVLRIVLSLPDKVVACHVDNENALRKIGIANERIQTISNALPQNTDKNTSDNKFSDNITYFLYSHQTIIASVTAWYPHYGVMELIQAFVGIRQSYPQSGLLLIFKEGGDAEFIKKIRIFIEDQHLAEHILVLQNIPSITALLRRADVFVRTPHSEGDSMAVREAIAEGLPVVASDVGYRPRGVILFKPADSGDLQAKIELALTSSRSPQEGRYGMANEGEQNLKTLVHMYQQLISSESMENKDLIRSRKQ